MIGLILAGGYATRLYPLTKNFPKSLLKVGQKPIIEHIIEKIEKIPDIEKIIISTNKKFESQFSEWKKNAKCTKEIIIDIEDSMEEKEKPGAIRGIGQIYQKYSGNFLIVGGDNLFDDDLQTVVNDFQTKQAPIAGIHKSSGELDTTQFGLVLVNEDNIIYKFEEKSQTPKSDLISTCIYAIPKNSLSKINSYLQNNNSDSPGHFIKWLSENQPVFGSILEGSWWDIGTIEAYEKINNHFENNSEIIAGQLQ
jgi:glucose-1-phosphate thymidylyltransferase